jgi:hypothetical protein
MWRCEIDSIAVTETSCSHEPTGTPAACGSTDVVTDAVDPPTAVVPGDSYAGWAVHTRPGMIFDVEDPTSAELDFVTERCIQACELEYADDPDVAANCTTTDGFLTPTLITTDSHASFFQIPPQYANGGGIYEGESLDCDLRTGDCCEAFDEKVCPGRPMRVTAAGQPVGRGEDWLYGMSGVVILDSPAMAEPAIGDLSGTMGGSLCTAGNGTAACPVYLGSAEIELLDPVTVVFSCGGETVTHTLDMLEMSLAQPAFGINSHTYPQWSAFPPGGLSFDAHTVIDATLELDTYLPIEEKVGLMFNDGWATVPAYGNFEVTFDLPCNGETIDFSAIFWLTATSWVGSPPEGVITIPNSVTCPSTVSLTASTSDAEYDVTSVRWRVDDVLLDEAVTAVDFTQAHDLTAVIHDSRGATTTVTKHVACE